MKTSADRIKAELLRTEFTRQELESLFAIIQLKLGNVREQIRITTETADGGNQYVSVLYSCLAELYLNRLGMKSPTLAETRSRNRKLFDELVTCTASLEEFAKTNLGKTSRLQITSLFKLYLRLAFEACIGMGGVITPARLLSLHKQCGALIDEQFPGYLGAKLLRVALNGTLSRLR
jgi:hypothetical protein